MLDINPVTGTTKDIGCRCHILNESFSAAIKPDTIKAELHDKAPSYDPFLVRPSLYRKVHKVKRSNTSVMRFFYVGISYAEAPCIAHKPTVVPHAPGLL